MPVWWTKRSRLPSSGVMKPKPLSSLNHFTTPVGIPSSVESCAAYGGSCCCLDPTPAPLAGVSPGLTPRKIPGDGQEIRFSAGERPRPPIEVANAHGNARGRHHAAQHAQEGAAPSGELELASADRDRG